MGGHPFHRIAKPNVEEEAEPRQTHRLAKPRTRTSPIKSSQDALPAEVPGSRSPVKVHTKKHSAGAVSTRIDEIDHRRDSRLQLRAYLYGSSREVTPEQVSEEERDGKTGITTVARGVRDRLSRTASMVSRLPSAKGSQSSLATDAQSSEDESARTAEEIKTKALTDYFTALNHVSTPVDEDMDPDSVTSPIRRRSLLTPGLATRMPDDILRRPPLPQKSFRLQQESDNYFGPQLSRQFALPCIASSPMTETITPAPRADTPCDLDHTHLGGFQLGTLHVTNGTATPSIRSPVQSRESSTVVYSKSSSTVVYSKPIQMDHQDMYLISSEAVWREQAISTDLSECPSLIPRCTSPDTFEEMVGQGVVAEPEIIDGSAGPVDDQLGENNRDRYAESLYEDSCLGHAVRNERYQRQASEQLPLAPLKNPNSESVIHSLRIADDYRLGTAINIYHTVESINDRYSPTAISSNPLASDHVKKELVARSSGINWRSIADDAELRHANSGTREDALRILNGDPITSEGPRPLSSSMGSSYNNHVRSSWQSINPVDSGYCSNESIKSLAKMSTPSIDQDDIMNTPRASVLGKSKSLSGSREVPHLVPQSSDLQSMLNEPQLAPPSQSDSVVQQHESTPTRPYECSPSNIPNTQHPDDNISVPSVLRSRKLRKSRPSSQILPSRSITVRAGRALDNADIPPVPSPVFARHAQRLEDFRSLEHTFPTLQHTASEDDLSSAYTHVPIRFPSPERATQELKSSDTSAVKAKRRRSLFRNDSRPLLSWRHSSVEPTKPRGRSRSQTRTSDHENTLQTIADFGTVTESLGGSPYDIARSTSVRNSITSNENIWHPHQMSTALPRTRTLKGMDEEAAADHARFRSRSRSQSLCRPRTPMSYDELHDDQQVLSSVRRPTSLVFDVPPIPALPTLEQIKQRETELSRSSADHSTLTPPCKIKKTARTPVEEHEVTETGVEDFRSSDNESSPIIESIENTVEAETAMENMKGPSWEAYRKTWSQHRKSAGESLLSNKTETPKVFEALPLSSGMNLLPYEVRPIGGPLTSNPPQPAIPMPQRQVPPIPTAPMPQTEPKRRSIGSESPNTTSQHLAVPASRRSRTPSPSASSQSTRSTPSPSPIPKRKAVAALPSRSFHVPFPAPQRQAPASNNDSASSLQSFHTASSNQQDATLSSRAERLSGRFDGGLSYGYEPGFGLGGSAGTRSAKSGASRKSVDVSLGFGIDLSDIPIFVAPSKGV